jgi:hypothetical protein
MFMILLKDKNYTEDNEWYELVLKSGIKTIEEAIEFTHAIEDAVYLKPSECTKIQEYTGKVTDKEPLSIRFDDDEISAIKAGTKKRDDFIPKTRDFDQWSREQNTKQRVHNEMRIAFWYMFRYNKDEDDRHNDFPDIVEHMEDNMED